MRAAVYEEFEGPITIRDVDDPTPGDHGVVLRVEATGICRSDWHGWMGHDPDISLPHVPGHEIAGVVESFGSQVKSWQRGDRVTLPFVCGCGSCVQCRSGNQQVCDRQFQPGFTAWGSYAEYVAIDYAEENLVALPDELDFVTAASLGCRFATSFRAVVAQARVSEGQGKRGDGLSERRRGVAARSPPYPWRKGMAVSGAGMRTLPQVRSLAGDGIKLSSQPSGAAVTRPVRHAPIQERGNSYRITPSRCNVAMSSQVYPKVSIRISSVFSP